MCSYLKDPDIYLAICWTIYIGSNHHLVLFGRFDSREKCVKLENVQNLSLSRSGKKDGSQETKGRMIQHRSPDEQD